MAKIACGPRWQVIRFEGGSKDGKKLWVDTSKDEIEIVMYKNRETRFYRSARIKTEVYTLYFNVDDSFYTARYSELR